jgi:hypothetical protein
VNEIREDEEEIIKYVVVISDRIAKKNNESFSEFIKRMRNYYAKKVGHNSVTIIVP